MAPAGDVPRHRWDRGVGSHSSSADIFRPKVRDSEKDHSLSHRSARAKDRRSFHRYSYGKGLLLGEAAHSSNIGAAAEGTCFYLYLSAYESLQYHLLSGHACIGCVVHILRVLGTGRRIASLNRFLRHCPPAGTSCVYWKAICRVYRSLSRMLGRNGTCPKLSPAKRGLHFLNTQLGSRSSRKAQLRILREEYLRWQSESDEPKVQRPHVVARRLHHGLLR
mmetsp:Transcript_24364/g.34083  ORF Transcript_24364/g.34083 Transcript_24364/m.34083 type:complete len:221 (-) Transcript_24364:245-907(-)